MAYPRCDGVGDLVDRELARVVARLDLGAHGSSEALVLEDPVRVPSAPVRPVSQSPREDFVRAVEVAEVDPPYQGSRRQALEVLGQERAAQDRASTIERDAVGDQEPGVPPGFSIEFGDVEDQIGLEYLAVR